MKVQPTVEELGAVLTQDMGLAPAMVIRFVLIRRRKEAAAGLAELERSLKPKPEKKAKAAK